MVKLLPAQTVHVDSVEWRPWDNQQRDTPFVADGTNGTAAWVKVLSRDSKTGAESLIYKLDPGWSAGGLQNTVYENLLVLDGEIDIDGQTLRKHAYSYRPEGHQTGPVTTDTGVSILAFAGSVGEPSSPIPVAHIDVEAMPWTPQGKGYIKFLRADEETLESFNLKRSVNLGVDQSLDRMPSHEKPEEVFFLDGRFWFYDPVTGGRALVTDGTYLYRPPASVHGGITMVEDITMFKHDYFLPGEACNKGLVARSFPRETPATKAFKEGRDPQLPRPW